MRYIALLAAILVASSLPVFAQTTGNNGVFGGVSVSGSITSGNCTKWLNSHTIADFGGPCGGTGAPASPAFGIGYNNSGSWGSLLPGGTGTYCLVWPSLTAAPTLTTSCGGGGSSAFGSITSGTNTSAAMVVGTGASIVATGSGTIGATSAPLSGVTGLGTGVATALGDNVGSAGAFVVNGGALGTPSSGNLTNATGLPISTGVSGLGTNVEAFLANPTSANLLAAVTSTSTGTGPLVFGTSPTFSTGTTLGFVTGSTQCLHVNTSGAISGTGSDCGSGGGAVSSVSAGASGSVSVTPTTGAVVVDLASQSAGTMCANLTGSSGAPTCSNTMPNLQAALVAANANIVSATLLTGPTNDYSPTGWGTTVAVLYLTPASGGSTLNGLVAGSNMQQVFVVNAEAAGGADNIILINQSSSDTTAANRFMSSGNLAIPPGGGVDCIDLQGSINRWWCH